MTQYQLDRKRQSLLYNGEIYTREKILSEKNGLPTVLNAFLNEWFSSDTKLTVHTSGSTGKPKTLRVSKEKMMQSAQLTCMTLRLSPGDNCLLCMSLNYIAGKMMVVRALISGMNLLVEEPCGHPLAQQSQPLHFVAMVPLQVYNSLQVPSEKERLAQIGVLLIGGGAIDPDLENLLQEFPGAVFSTYGMTETLSHIALRRINGKEASKHYVPFPSVRLSLTDNQTLIINAPLVCKQTLYTHDVANIFPDGSFVILGRLDNTINTGGIKIQIEEIEEKVRPYIHANFAFTSIPNPRLGEALVLLIEHTNSTRENDELFIRTINDNIAGVLSKYQRPKHTLLIEKIPQTATYKTDRSTCKEVAKKALLIKK